MKICICTAGPDLDSQVSPVFGRAPYFLIFDLESKKFKSVSNSAPQAFRGAGVTASQLIISEKSKVVIAGHFGPNAFSFLHISGVKAYSVSGLTARQAIEEYNKGVLKEMTAPGRGPSFPQGKGSGTGPRRQRQRRRGR